MGEIEESGDSSFEGFAAGFLFPSSSESEGWFCSILSILSIELNILFCCIVCLFCSSVLITFMDFIGERKRIVWQLQ